MGILDMSILDRIKEQKMKISVKDNLITRKMCKIQFMNAKFQYKLIC